MTPSLALATFVIVAVLLYGLFTRSERRLAADTRRRITRYLRAERPSAQDERNFAGAFLDWFDHAFKVRKRQVPLLGEVVLPSFWRSVLVTFLSLLFLAVVWLFNKPGMGRVSLGDFNGLGGPQEDMVTRLLLVYGGATILSNWIPDYLSLIESRFILGKMSRARSWPRRLAWLALDAVATLAISFFAIHLAMVVMLPLVTPWLNIEVGCLTPETYSIETTWTLFVSGLTFQSPAGTLNYDATGVYIYSTFLTSLWVWLYLGSGLLFRAAGALLGSRQLGSTRALRAMGLLAVASIGLLYWSNWLHRRATGAEIYIEHSEADTDRAQALARELEAEGLWVQSSAELDEDEHLTLLRNAEAVVVLQDGLREGDPALEAARIELAEQIRCGERVEGSAMIVGPGLPAAELVEFATKAPTILPMHQVHMCAEMQDITLDLEGCEQRRQR